MTEKNLVKYKRKYDIFRHHAWAGLGFLSILLAIRIIEPSLAHYLVPIIVFVIAYVIISLIFTYVYRKGLSIKQDLAQTKSTSVELEKAKIDAEIEKQRLKIEKKKAKNTNKSIKKNEKKK